MLFAQRVYHGGRLLALNNINDKKEFEVFKFTCNSDYAKSPVMSILIVWRIVSDFPKTRGWELPFFNAVPLKLNVEVPIEWHTKLRSLK